MTPEEILAAASGAGWTELARSAHGRAITTRTWAGAGAPVLLFGAIHGDEPLGPRCLLELAALLDARTGKLPRTVILAPVINPDGLLANTRANARGVDLNRNFPAKNWQSTHRPGYYPGPRAASEPETRALLDLLERTQPTRVIAIHSPYRTVNYDGPARGLAERMSARNGYGVAPDLGYPTPGSFGSYYAIDRGHEVVTLELPEIGFHDAWAENKDALLVACALLD